jgi:hypothetical protein
MEIVWPALLRLSGEAELQVVHDAMQWSSDPHLHGAHYLPSDTLIDAEGRVYALDCKTEGRVSPVFTGEKASLETVVTAVQAHAAQMGSCCVAKFSVSSIREAIDAVEDGRCLR